MEPALINTEKKKKEVVYGVFEDDDGYLIYKLGSVECVGEDAEFPLQPIEALKSLPEMMFFFSVGPKLYMCGGCADNSYSIKAYMFDISSKGIVSIDSMNSPKPLPLVFGPVDDHKFYVFSGSTKSDYPSFEMFDTTTNKWESLPVPPSSFGLTFRSSALCGSNILVSPHCPSSHHHLFIYCTRSGVWSQLPHHYPLSDQPSLLPFVKAYSLFDENSNVQILLGIPSHCCLPGVYSVKNDNGRFGPVGPFKQLSDVTYGLLMEHLKELPDFLGGWGTLRDFFSLKDNSVCIVRCGERGFLFDEHFVIDILDVIYSVLEGTDVIVKVENSLKIKYCSKSCMLPMHFFLVPA